jgi:cell shape-determining protein MreC
MIKKIKDFIRNYKEKKRQTEEIRKLISPKENYISYLSDNGDVSIRISVQNITDAEAMKLGDILFSISNGLYIADTINVLKDLQKQDYERATFVEKAIDRWKELIDKSEEKYYNNLNAPIISPRSFMKKENHEQPQS